MTGSVASAQLRSFIERIERLECEKKSIADDIRDVKAEAKGCGFDVGTINAIIKLRKVDANERAERDALLDTYLIALGMLPETAEEAEPEAAAEVAGNDLREPVAAEQGQIIREGDAPRETDRFGGDASCPDTEFQMDRATEGSFETGSEAAEKGRKATATVAAPADLNHAGAGESPATLPKKSAEQAGGEHEVATGSALRAGLAAPTSNTGEGAACALPAKPKFVLRPYCRNPGETCGGSGTTHCHSCLKAREEVAA